MSESIRISYRGHIDLYLVPHLGSVPVEDLSADMVEAVYRHLLTVGLSAATVRRINATLSSALSAATRDGVIAANPAQRVRSRRPDAFHARVWSVEQAVTFLRSVETDDLYLLWRLAVITGLRRGEILGLRACDVEPEAGCVTVRQNRVVVSGRVVTKTPKTRRSHRTIAVDGITAGLLKSRLKTAINPDDLIFTCRPSAKASCACRTIYWPARTGWLSFRASGSWHSRRRISFLSGTSTRSGTSSS